MLFPLHGDPKTDGSGLSQSRVLDFKPPLQVAEQTDQPDHRDQPPSTMRRTDKQILNIVSDLKFSVKIFCLHFYVWEDIAQIQKQSITHKNSKLLIF